MRDGADISLFALLFLCFLQLLTDFVAGIYALGLLETRVPPEVACVFLLLAPAGRLIRSSMPAHRITRRLWWRSAFESGDAPNASNGAAPRRMGRQSE